MEFPELLFEDETNYRAACCEVRTFFREHAGQLSGICAIGQDIRQCYQDIEPFFHNYTEAICHCCATPCCVNRHGFPDFEDLILFQAMGLNIPHYNFHVKDTDICQFLREDGCILPRCNRSYRCTWYFCDYVLDEFQHAHGNMFQKFDCALSILGKKRCRLLNGFKAVWFDYM